MIYCKYKNLKTNFNERNILMKKDRSLDHTLTQDLFGCETCPECDGAGEIEIQKGPLHHFTFVTDECDICKGTGSL